MRRGISPVVATLLIVMVAIIAVMGSYLLFSGSLVGRPSPATTDFSKLPADIQAKATEICGTDTRAGTLQFQSINNKDRAGESARARYVTIIRGGQPNAEGAQVIGTFLTPTLANTYNSTTLVCGFAYSIVENSTVTEASTIDKFSYTGQSDSGAKLIGKADVTAGQPYGYIYIPSFLTKSATLSLYSPRYQTLVFKMLDENSAPRYNASGAANGTDFAPAPQQYQSTTLASTDVAVGTDGTLYGIIRLKSGASTGIWGDGEELLLVNATTANLWDLPKATFSIGGTALPDAVLTSDEAQAFLPIYTRAYQLPGQVDFNQRDLFYSIPALAGQNPSTRVTFAFVTRSNYWSTQINGMLKYGAAHDDPTKTSVWTVQQIDQLVS